MRLHPGLTEERAFEVSGALLTDVGGALDHEVFSTP
jgi:hypothetical protein